MLSKCANPKCFAVLRYLHDGEIFYLSPTPDAQIALGKRYPSMLERFWLCADCAKRMTLVWGGTTVKLVPLTVKTTQHKPPQAPVETAKRVKRGRLRALASAASRGDG